MRLPFAIPFLLLTLPTQGQLLDSIGLFLREPPKFVAKLDIRGSFVGNRNVTVLGAMVGREHARRFQYGIGYAFLVTPVEGAAFVEGLGWTTTRLRMGYVAPYLDYAFHQRGRWELRLPVRIGIGAGSTVYRDAAGRQRKLQRTGLVLYEPLMTVQYRFAKYFAVGGGWGFRLVAHTRSSLGGNLSAPVYAIGLRVFFGDLWQDIRPATE